MLLFCCCCCCQTLAHHYDLHPLAVEDVLHFQRIKAVTYSGVCGVRQSAVHELVLCCSCCSSPTAQHWCYPGDTLTGGLYLDAPRSLWLPLLRSLIVTGRQRSPTASGSISRWTVYVFVLLQTTCMWQRTSGSSRRHARSRQCHDHHQQQCVQIQQQQRLQWRQRQQQRCRRLDQQQPQ